MRGRRGWLLFPLLAFALVAATAGCPEQAPKPKFKSKEEYDAEWLHKKDPPELVAALAKLEGKWTITEPKSKANWTATCDTRIGWFTMRVGGNGMRYNFTLYPTKKPTAIDLVLEEVFEDNLVTSRPNTQLRGIYDLDVENGVLRLRLVENGPRPVEFGAGEDVWIMRRVEK